MDVVVTIQCNIFSFRICSEGFIEMSTFLSVSEWVMWAWSWSPSGTSPSICGYISCSAFWPPRNDQLYSTIHFCHAVSALEIVKLTESHTIWIRLNLSFRSCVSGIVFKQRKGAYYNDIPLHMDKIIIGTKLNTRKYMEKLAFSSIA